jgi:uncharacterized protein
MQRTLTRSDLDTMTVMLPKFVLATALSATIVFGVVSAQETTGSGTSRPAKKHFLILLKPARAGFAEAPTVAEQKLMGEHFAYHQKLMAEGKVVVGGPSINGDKTFGIIVIEAASEPEARMLMAGDPSIKGGVMKGELLPFTLSLLRGR